VSIARGLRAGGLAIRSLHRAALLEDRGDRAGDAGGQRTPPLTALDAVALVVRHVRSALVAFARARRCAAFVPGYRCEHGGPVSLPPGAHKDVNAV
jgi:hypothetical protein